jgi:hypothetical protein
MRVKNTGSRRGAEVVQFYVHATNPPLPRPDQKLKGFVKVGLAPGEEKAVHFNLDRHSFAYFDVAKHELDRRSRQFRDSSREFFPRYSAEDVGNRTGKRAVGSTRRSGSCVNRSGARFSRKLPSVARRPVSKAKQSRGTRRVQESGVRCPSCTRGGRAPCSCRRRQLPCRR